MDRHPHHLLLDAFGAFLARDWPPGALEEASAAVVAGANRAQPERFAGAERGPSPLAECYYEHIRRRCPPGS